MFDLIRSIAAGFGGKLSEAPEARKLVWLLIVGLFFSGCCIFFIAYVSYSRYRAVTGFLPGADVVSVGFTSGIALFMYYVSSHVSAFCVERWLYGKSRLKWQGVIIFAVCGILVGLIDYQMNLDGAEDVAEQSAGEVAAVDERALLAHYTPEIERLEKRKAAVLEKYWWKGKLYFEPYPVTRHSQATWSLDTAKVNQLDRQIAVQEDLKAAALADARAAYKTSLTQRTSRRDVTHRRLRVAVRGVYFLQFLLTLVLAFILLRMDEALNGEISLASESSTGEQPIGFDTTPSPSTAQANELARLRRELEALRNQQNPSINTPINTGINTPEAVERLIFEDSPTASEPSGVDLDEVAFLRKYKVVVRAILDGEGYSEITRNCSVSKSTAQNVKRSMRAVKLL